jgi:hypothetical protein
METGQRQAQGQRPGKRNEVAGQKQRRDASSCLFRELGKRLLAKDRATFPHDIILRLAPQRELPKVTQAVVLLP